MTENEQIEEMALVMCGRESCMTCTHFVNATKCAAIVSAKKLYNADYRKASEVAREIFEEIVDECFDQFGYLDFEAFYRCREKYTGGTTDDRE